MKSNHFRSTRPWVPAATSTAVLVATLAVVGCAHAPPPSDRGKLVASDVSLAAFEDAVKQKVGLCFRRAFCIPPIPVPVWQEPLLSRETTLKPPSDKAEPLPVSKVCQLRHERAADGTLRSSETCVLFYAP